MKLAASPRSFLAMAMVSLAAAWANADSNAESVTANPLLIDIDFDRDTQQGPAERLLRHPAIHLEPGVGPDGSDAIRVDYVGYEKGSQRVSVYLPLSQSVSRATLSFDVRFDQDFKWAIGGKLHGLGPQKPVTGGRSKQPDGWSARMMWKTDGKVMTYLYDQSPEKIRHGYHHGVPGIHRRTMAPRRFVCRGQYPRSGRRIRTGLDRRRAESVLAGN